MITADRTHCLIIGALTDKSSFIGKVPWIETFPRWPEIIQGAPCPMRVGCHLVAPQANDVRKCRLSAVRPLCITSGWGGGG